MDTLPERPIEGTRYTCDPSRWLPALDTAVAVVALAATVTVAVAQVGCMDGSPEPGCSTVFVGYIWAPFGLLYGLSAESGFSEARRCRLYEWNQLPLMPAPPASPPPDPLAVGKPCQQIAGVAHGGRCPRGLVCRGDVCVP